MIKEIIERLNKISHSLQDFVFTFQGKSVKSIKTCLNNALAKTGIKDFRLYDLRHTFVTNARKARVDRIVIMKLTGHKTLSMFTRYNTVDQADAKEAMQRLDAYFNQELADCCNSAASIKKGSGDFH